MTQEYNGEIPEQVMQGFLWLCSQTSLSKKKQTATLLAMRDKITSKPRFIVFHITPEEGGLARMEILGEIFDEERAHNVLRAVESYPESGVELHEPTNVPESFKQ